jgi:hypothetical protein
MKKPFYFIPHRAIIDSAPQVLPLLNLPGASYALDREGIIIEPERRAYIRACLVGIELLKGEWEEPYEV